MKIETKIDEALQEELLKIKNEPKFVNFIFNYCETQDDRKKLLSYIKNESDDRKDVLLMASQIGIESGTVEGKLKEE